MLQQLRHLLVTLRMRVRQHGLAATARWIFYRVTLPYREWRRGIDTREFSHSIEVGDDGEYNAYEPIEYRSFDLIMDYLTIAEDNREGFLDYGCGKGRAVVLAATYPFTTVLGVERSESLVGIAEENIRRARPRLRCANVQVVCADAREYAVPDQITTIFFFNPFRGKAFMEVLARIQESLAKRPRKLRIVYVYLKAQNNPLAKCGWLRQEQELTTGFWDDYVRCIVYVAERARLADGSHLADSRRRATRRRA